MPLWVIQIQVLCSTGQIWWISPWHVAQIPSVQRFSLLPIPSHLSWIKPKSIYLLLTGWKAVSVLTSSSVHCRMKPGTSIQQLLMPAHELCIPSRANMSVSGSPTAWIQCLLKGFLYTGLKHCSISKASANPEVQVICVVHRPTVH